MKKFTPMVKGLITGIAMLILALAMYYLKLYRFSGLEYLMYILYAGGILWTLISFSTTPQFTGKFQELFGQGFRCFIIVTLIMTVYTGVFSMTHPKMADDIAVLYKEDMVKQKNKTPAEIDDAVAGFKKQFTTQLVSRSIFGYLISGAIFTAAGAAMVLLRRNKSWT